MSLLLKITEGMMKGAEVALISGTRIKIGSDDNCDIVISDSTVASVACELEVHEDEVVVIHPDGMTESLPSFTICELESLAFAVGPANGAWPELQVRKKAEKQEMADEFSKSPESSGTQAEANLVVSEAEVGKRKNGKRLLVFLLLLIIMVAVFALLWLKHPEYIQQLRARISGMAKASAANVTEHSITLEQLAEDYHLEFNESKERPLLKGNFKLATERLAVRALALNANRNVILDLTDDETMKNAAESLLFSLTEGKLTVDSLENRSAVLAGKLQGRAQLESVQAAFYNDLPTLEALDVSKVKIDSLENTVILVPSEEHGTLLNGAKKESSRDAETLKMPSLLQNLPIAGILTTPYPCVVMQNGARYMVGAQIGNAVLEKIEADRLSLRLNDQIFFWHP